jgi:hypothetical protein
VDAGREFGTWQGHDIANHSHATDKLTQTGGGDMHIVLARGPFVWGETTPTGGAETRPRNVALLPCIKY